MSVNNCTSCKHKDNPQGGHCYMFKVEPSTKCLQHTGLNKTSTEVIKGLIDRLNESDSWLEDAGTYSVRIHNKLETCTAKQFLKENHDNNSI